MIIERVLMNKMNDENSMLGKSNVLVVFFFRTSFILDGIPHVFLVDALIFPCF